MSGAQSLFDGGAPRVRTIAAAAPFLDTLIDALLASLDDADPFALADCIILAPNRRGAQAIQEALARRRAGASLLPNVRPLADIEDDPDVWGPEPLDFAIPPAIDPMRRRFELARMVRARDAAEGGVDDPVRALAYADELARLLDSSMAADGVNWADLAGLVEDQDLAAHWMRSTAFLSIITQFWPLHLQENDLSDPAARKAAVLRALADRWRAHPPLKPVIIAGSTGSLAPTRALMEVVAGLPKGVVILPGLDRDLDDSAWDAIEPGHPQFTMKQTLAHLNLARSEVGLIDAAVSRSARARHILLRETMAPAVATADWRVRLERAGGVETARLGLEGVRLLEARTEEEEASVIAILLRESYETPGQTAALVTPDAGLARRVAAKLRRWNIAARSTIGTPFVSLPMGAFLLTLCALGEDDGDSVALAALLKSPFVCAELAPNEKERLVGAIEHAGLRGARRHLDLAALCARLQGEAQSLMSAISDALTPLRACMQSETCDLAQCADALIEAAENLHDADLLWSDEDGAYAASVLRGLVEHGGCLGGMAPGLALRALKTVLSEREAPPPGGGDARIAILGALEARLERADRLILGGLNEGVWPKPPPEDGLLPRGLRRRLGLPSPDVRLGLAAHDFSQLAATPDLILTRAQRTDGAPRVASRWLWRLTTLAKAAGVEAMLSAPESAAPLHWAQAMDAPRFVAPAKAPAPRPPAHARPRKLSFTDMTPLMRDPYAIFAKRILKLRALRKVGEAPGPAERGDAIHKAIDVFGDARDPAYLLELLDKELAQSGYDAAQRLMESHRLRQAAHEFVAWQNEARDVHKVSIVRERAAQLSIEGFTLHGRADALHLWPDRTASIIDFKSGNPPGDKEVQNGLEPQLTLEGAALMLGGFENISAHTPRDYIYWRFAATKYGARHVNTKEDAESAAETARIRFVSRMRRYQLETEAFKSKPIAKFAKEAGDYDLLARRAEWADVESDE